MNPCTEGYLIQFAASAYATVVRLYDKDINTSSLRIYKEPKGDSSNGTIIAVYISMNAATIPCIAELKTQTKITQ